MAESDQTPNAAPPAAPVETPLPWAPIAWFGVLLVLWYAPVLQLLIRDWLNDDDMGHGFFVPLVAGYIVWLSREELLQLKLEPSRWGLVVVVVAGLQLIAATLGVEFFLARTSFVLALAGVVLTLGGWVLLRALAFPLILLLFMIPLPAIIFNQITFPLQLLASQLAEISLSAIGIPVLRDGNILELPNQRLSVVEACSGIRSLLSLSFLSLVYAFFFDERPWMRWALLICTIPIAIIANAGRVTITGLLWEFKPEYAEGFFHTFEGWLIFMVAVVFLVAAHRVLCIAASFHRSPQP
jgi:exosortase